MHTKEKISKKKIAEQDRSKIVNIVTPEATHMSMTSLRKLRQLGDKFLADYMPKRRKTHSFD